MRNEIIIWEAPRSRGTAICYGLYNGLTHQGVSTRFDDEPDNYVTITKIFSRAGSEGVIKHHLENADPDQCTEQVIIQKRQARHFYDPRSKFDLVNDDWLGRFKHVFLIRKPSEIIRSYSKATQRVRDMAAKIGDQPLSTSSLTMHRIGVEPLFQLYTDLKQKDVPDIKVFDANDLTRNPGAGIGTLCNVIGLRYSHEMIEWDNVDTNVLLDVSMQDNPFHADLLASKGLQAYVSDSKDMLTGEEAELADACEPFYQEMLLDCCPIPS